METGNGMDDLLKRAMQFDSGELPEPDPSMQTKLRKKVLRKKTLGGNRFISVIIGFFNIDIKLYHAGLAMVGVALVLIIVHSTGERSTHAGDSIMVADTNSGSSLKDDTFLVRNFSAQIY